MIALSIVPIAFEVRMMGLRAGGRPLGYIALASAGWIAAPAFASTWILAPARTTLGRPRPKLALLAIALPLAFAAAAVAGNIAYPETVHGPTPSLFVHARCFMMAIGLTIAPVAALLYAFRRSDPVRPATTGAALGALAASWAGAVLAIQCPETHPLHMVLAHAAPVAIFAGLGVLFGRRVLGLRWIR